jgi:hypothetical protein
MRSCNQHKTIDKDEMLKQENIRNLEEQLIN